jgi:outer membrane protein
MNRFGFPSLLLCAGALVVAGPIRLVAEESIVTVSFNAAVIQTAEAQKQLGALQSKFAPRQAQLKALNDEVESLQKQLSDTTQKLTDAERSAREQTLETKQRQLQRQAEDLRTDSQNESQDVLQAISQKLYTFLQKYAQQHAYSAVIERGSDTAPVVWYAANNLDITEQLVKAYNEQSSNVPPSVAKPAKALPESPSPSR